LGDNLGERYACAASRARCLTCDRNLPLSLSGAPIPFPRVSDGDCLVQALTARHIPYRYLSADEITDPKWTRQTIVAFCIDDVLYYFGKGSVRRSDPCGIRVPGPLINNAKTARFVRNKDRTKAFLYTRGFNVPKGATFSRHALTEAESYFADFAPSLSAGTCVKPSNGSLAQHVAVGIRDLPSFRIAFETVAKHHQQVLVEETLAGKVYRFFCLAGQVIAVYSASFPCVKGDGAHTIEDLVRFKNVERSLNHNPYYARHPLRLGPRELSFLRERGLEPAHVPESGENVFLSNLSDLHCGGEKIDATDAVHRSYIEVVERVVGLFPGLMLCGPDVIIANARLPATSDNYHVLEVNGIAPGFVDHHYPWSGQSRDVTGPLIDHLTAAGRVRPLRTLLSIARGAANRVRRINLRHRTPE
jgi:D-alanine-D-alanine ligase-like ATP-grasp enzyme